MKVVPRECRVAPHLSGELLKDVATYSVQNGNGLSEVMPLS